LGLIGPVPARVQANTKAALLTLVDDAVAGGWSARRVCALLQVNPLRIARWRARAAVDALVDRVARVSPVHTLLAWEVAAVLTLARDWGDVDRSHRKLAHRGSYLRLPWWWSCRPHPSWTRRRSSGFRALVS
jgi:hypothetical protein